MFIAIVIRKEYIDGDSVSSLRPDGSVSAFVDADRDTVVERALSARDSYRFSGRRYEILVGELTGRVTTPRRFKVERL